MTDLAFRPRPRLLFICGNRNHTTTMHAIARELPDCERWFTPYYCDDGTVFDVLRRLHLLEFAALDHDFLKPAGYGLAAPSPPASSPSKPMPSAGLDRDPGDLQTSPHLFTDTPALLAESGESCARLRVATERDGSR